MKSKYRRRVVNQINSWNSKTMRGRIARKRDWISIYFLWILFMIIRHLVIFNHKHYHSVK